MSSLDQERDTPFKLIFGCGYLGHRVARVWKEQGEKVAVVTRSAERARSLSANGFSTIVADVTNPTTLGELPVVDTVLFAVGFDRSQTHSIGEVYADGLRNVLSALPAATKRVIYISSTGVYGGAGGDWIDEQTPASPTREGGRACLAAEQRLQSRGIATAGIIMRLAGIYGPGRIPKRDDLVAGKPIQGNADGWLNLIHVDDAVRAVLAAEDCGVGTNVFNVSDGNPARRKDYYEELARLLAAAPPQFAMSSASSSERARGTADKRVSNAKMLTELHVQLQYPSYRDGLAAIVSGL